MENTQWDAIVIGGGVAGLSAAQMLGRARRRTLVLDAGEPRNRFAAHMHGVLGHDGISPQDLLAHGRTEAASYGVTVRAASVARVDESADAVRVALDDGSTQDARALVIATGITDDLPPIPGLAENWGTSVLHCPYCHGWEVRDGRLGVLLVSPLQAHQAQLVRQWSEDVIVFAQIPLEAVVIERLHARGIEIVDEPVVEVDGEAVRLRSGRRVPVSALFAMGTPLPQDAFVAHLGLERADTPFGTFLAVDVTGRTSSARIWAAGNVVNPAATVPASMGAGAMAGAAANAALVEEDFSRAVSIARGRDEDGRGASPDGVVPRPDGAVPSTDGVVPRPDGAVQSTDGAVQGPDGAVPRPASAAGHHAEPAMYWEARYADRMWSGRPNRTVVDIVSPLTPGRSLDLGCGEGADTIWLAQRGWHATGIDISPTAVTRARAAAEDAGVTARFVVADLSSVDDAQHPSAHEQHPPVDDARHPSAHEQPVSSAGGAPYDLVTASFFQSPVDLDRIGALRRAAQLVAPGGRMLIVSHAAPPSWATPEHVGSHVFLSPREDLRALDLDPSEWATEIAEVVTREVTAPDGSPATLDDSVVLVHRSSSA